MDRRQMFATAGGLGLGLIASSSLSAAEKESNKPVTDVLKSLQVKATTPDLGMAPVGVPSLQNLAKAKLKPHEPKGRVYDITDEQDQLIATVVSYTCESNRINSLGFEARCVSFRVRNIQWKAGDAWPIYSQYCPVDDFSQPMHYPHAKVHQIVPSFGGFYWIGCSSSASGCGERVSQVQFAVNDSRYDDNRGTFVVDIISWSR